MNKKWSLVKEAYVGSSNILVNQINDSPDHGNSSEQKTEGNEHKKENKFTFLNVVKEAVKKDREESKKKERPSLLKFLEKFEDVDIPESVTPNPNSTFSHFEEVAAGGDQEEGDGGLQELQTGLSRVSGTCQELAARRVSSQGKQDTTVSGCGSRNTNMQKMLTHLETYIHNYLKPYI